MSEPVELKSSAIASAQHNEADKTVTVTFTSGSQATVPCTPEVFAEFLASDSPGKFWNTRLKQSN